MDRETIRSVAGSLVAVAAAAWAYTSGEVVGWGVALVAAGVIEPQTVLGWVRGRARE